MSLEDRIKALELTTEADDADSGYNYGIKDAAALAAEADELMDRMAEALRDCAEEDADGLDAAMARDTLEMYNNWKEQTND